MPSSYRASVKSGWTKKKRESKTDKHEAEQVDDEKRADETRDHVRLRGFWGVRDVGRRTLVGPEENAEDRRQTNGRDDTEHAVTQRQCSRPIPVAMLGATKAKGKYTNEIMPYARPRDCSGVMSATMSVWRKLRPVFPKRLSDANRPDTGRSWS